MGAAMRNGSPPKIPLWIKSRYSVPIFVQSKRRSRYKGPYLAYPLCTLRSIKLRCVTAQILTCKHNMYAYRFTDPHTNILKHDNDDDGEKYAGSRLAELLHLRKDDGVLVVVSRWY